MVADTKGSGFADIGGVDICARAIMSLAILLALPSGVVADRIIDQVRLSGDGGATFGSTVTVDPGATVTIEITVSTDDNGTGPDWQSTVLDFDPDGDNAVCDESVDVTNAGTHVSLADVPVPVTEGTYTVTVRAFDADCSTSDASSAFTLKDSVTVASEKALIMSDDFDRQAQTAEVGNNWDENECDVWNIGIPSKSTRAVRFLLYGTPCDDERDDYAMTRVIDLTGRGNAEAVFKYRTSGTEDIDVLNVQWRAAGVGSYQDASTITLADQESPILVGRVALPFEAQDQEIDLRVEVLIDDMNDLVLLSEIAVYAGEPGTPPDTDTDTDTDVTTDHDDAGTDDGGDGDSDTDSNDGTGDGGTTTGSCGAAGAAPLTVMVVGLISLRCRRFALQCSP